MTLRSLIVARASARCWFVVCASAMLATSIAGQEQRSAASASKPSVAVTPIGRIYVDAGRYAKDRREKSNGVDVRALRLGVHGEVEGWQVELEADFGQAAVQVKDAWAKHSIPFGAVVQLGNFKEPYGLEALTTSRFTPFMERAVSDAFSPGRSLGASLTMQRPRWWIAAGAFGQEIDALGATELAGGSEGWAVTARGILRHALDSAGIVHVGLSVTRRTPDAVAGGLGRFRFREYPESRIDRARYLNTGYVGQSRHKLSSNLEAALTWGALSLQAERGWTTVERIKPAVAPSFSGGYTMVSWFVTGERRVYLPDVAEFMPPHPRHRTGAVELLVRTSHASLNDADASVFGGEARQWTAGLNWYLSQRVRVMLNHVWVNHDSRATGAGTLPGDDDFRVLQSRFQVWF